MNILCAGAHPDDAEFYAGGSMIQWATAGHRVTAVSLTNGDAGHHETPLPELAARRRAEALEAARRGGYEAVTWDVHDGELMPTLELRREMVRLIRRCRADVVLCHRPYDYHPDHRYTGVLVQDAAFMVTVPHVCPEEPALETNPVFLYMTDPFSREAPFQADLAVPIDRVDEAKWRLLDAMPSQFYEWLPWLEHRLDEVPPATAPEARFAWLQQFYGPVLDDMFAPHRAALERIHGAAAAGVRRFEVFGVCGYGRTPGDEEARALCLCGAPPA